MARHLLLLYQDDYYVAVNKPARLMVHRSRLDSKQSCFALQMVRDQIGRKVYPVHRLDRPTAGVLVFGLTPEAAGRLARRFAEKTVKKKYLAVVRGYTDSHGIIDSPLIPDAYSAKKAQESRPALTEYRRLATIELPFPVGRYATSRYSLVDVRPVSGRMHQIRRHMHHISHHVVGDTMYGDGKHNRFFRDRLNCSGLLLAAVRLRFVHPYTQGQTLINAQLNPDFSALIRRFGWQNLLPPTWISG